MQFRILGPLEVAEGDCLVSLPGAQRALLARLLLSANEVVSADRLIEELWGEDGPESGRAALQVRVSQLRKALGGDSRRIATRAPGYVLRVDRDELDLYGFERLVSEADAAEPAKAAAKLREALDLWRGAPLDDLSYASFAQPAIRRLEELRLAAYEKRIDADLELGRQAEVIAELEALVEEHPLREHLHAQLMLALYRCGRQADALGAYQHARRVLVEELGIEPSAPLRRLEQAILRQEASLDLAAAVAPRDPPFASGSRSSRPDPRRHREMPHNLPAHVSSFVGRERQLSELRQLLSRARVITLTGPGGVGKTRLALQFAARTLDESDDGPWFVDLAPLTDATLVVAKLAGVLAIPQQPGRSLPESLIASCRNRQALVILDNCEHVIDGAAQIAEELVGGCPKLILLATSREPLAIEGEHLYRVPPLFVAPASADPGRLLACDAVRLFADRARQQRSDFAVDPDNAATVGRLCRRLDGIPLAIELAAARLRTLALDEIDDRLDERFRLLTSGHRVAPPRQQTLKALIDWSYDLLNSREQEMLERLSVFAGGFDLQSAEAVAGAGFDSPIDVLDQLAALVDKSLLHSDDAVSSRYRMLDTVRDYASAKLLARSQAAALALRAAHCDHYLALAETAAPHLIGHGQTEWLDRLEREFDNLRAASSTSLQAPDPDGALRLGRALRDFWLYRQPRAEGAAALCAALDRADAQEPTLTRGRALAAAGILLTMITGEYGAATARAQEALAVSRALSDNYLRAEALHVLALINESQGNEQAHFELTGEALALATALDDPHLMALILMTRGSSPFLSRAERARTVGESLRLAHQAGNKALYLGALNNLGYLEIEAGNVTAARGRLAEGVRLAHEIGARRPLSLLSCTLGFASYLDHADTEARAMFDQSLAIAQRSGDQLMVAYAQLGLALIASRTGDAQAAATLHGAADVIHDRLGTRLDSLESRLRDADLTGVRAALGDTAFQSAYDAGRASDVPAAVLAA
ncbi:MAG TPA: BTAD domain-containing putative transcriptional regulator [Solirubrobacteraceae bacterium]|nr:BTAD domain-containing putative transcriptional regulator [Solirubrobacteraceae bacterium]